VVPPTGGPITTTPGTGTGTVKPPIWTPPAFTPAGPATPRPADDIDQNPLPPTPPATPPAGIQIVKGGTLNICKKYNGTQLTIGGFRWYGEAMYNSSKLYTINEYYAKYGNFGSFSNGLNTLYDEAVKSLLNPNPQYVYKCTMNGYDDFANW
jgi:hypothetical protein